MVNLEFGTDMAPIKDIDESALKEEARKKLTDFGTSMSGKSANSLISNSMISRFPRQIRMYGAVPKISISTSRIRRFRL